MTARFNGFSSRQVRLSEATIYCRVGGSGPPLLLLHGCPQTHLMWHKLVDELSERFTVVAADLRGYGRSSKPVGTLQHSNYSFRAMALDQVELMAQLGFNRFVAVGHDRGARVLHRMALDHPSALSRIVLLDILPTSVLYPQTDRSFATAYWEWFFFVQTTPFPEKLLSADPLAFLRYEIGSLLDAGVIPADVFDEYLKALSSEPDMHGMCEDYRAGATVDLAHDAADTLRRVECPVQVLWGRRNQIWERFEMLETWRRFAVDVTGTGIDCGHYLAEEAPREVISHLLPFALNA